MIKLWLFTFLFLGFTLNLHSQPIPQNGLVAWYPFNANANDQSGNSLNGMVNGASLTTDRFGNPNSAYDFDGLNDFIELAHSQIINFGPNDDFTVSVWVLPQTQLGSGNVVNIIGKWEDFPGGSNPSYPFSIRMRRTNPIGTIQMLRLDQTCSNFPILLSNGSIIDNDWHNLIYLKDGNSLKMYIDGTLINQTTDVTSCVTGNTLPTYIGKRGGTFNPSHYRGKIDDIAIYDRALSECEIQKLLNIDLNANLIAHYPFNGNALDLSGNNNNASIQGATFAPDRNGNPNSSASFDGVNDLITRGSIIDVSTQNAMSISAWFYPETPFNSQLNRYSGVSIGTKETGEISLRETTSSLKLFQGVLADGNSLSTNGNNTSALANTVPYIYNKWYHVVSTYQNQKVRIYVNGQFVSENTGFNGNGGLLSNIPANSNLFIGTSFGTNNDQKFYRGRLDDVRIYNRKLNDCEIVELFQPGSVVSNVSTVQACSSDTLALSTGLDSAFWTDSQGNFLGSGSNLDYHVSNQTFVVATGFNFCGCLQNDTFNIQLKSQPSYNLQATFSICPNVIDTLPFSFNTGGTISWSDGSLFVDSTALNPIVLPIQNTSNNSLFQTIYADITDLSSGCTVKDSAVLEITPRPGYTWGSDSFIVCHRAFPPPVLWTPTNPNQYSQLRYVYYGDTFFLPSGQAVPFLFQGENYDTVDRTDYFKLLIEDINGCHFTDSVFTLTYARFYSEAGGDTIICSGDSIEIGESFQLGFTYNWNSNPSISSGIISDPTFSFINPDTVNNLFQLFVNKTDDSTMCTEKDSIEINVNYKPFDDLSGPNIVCPGVDSAEYFVGRPFTDYSYSWFLDGGAISVNSNDSVIVAWDSTNFNAFLGHFPTNSLGCVGDTFIWNVRINPLLIPEIDVDTLNYCERDKAQVYNILYPIVNSNYTWFVEGGQIVSGQGNDQVSVLWDSVGIGRIWVAEENITNIDSCFGTSDTLTINILPDPVLSSIQGPLDVCDFGDTLTFITQSTLPGTIFWNSDSISQIIGNNLGDTIRISTVSDGNFTINAFVQSNEGCLSDTIEETVNVRYLQIPEIEIDTNKICFWDSTDFVFRIKDKYDSSVYQWTSNHGQIIQGQGESVMRLRVYQADTIQIYVRELNSAVEDTCYGVSDTIEVYFYPKPERDLSIVGPDTLCFSQDCSWYKYPGWENSTFYWSSDAGVCNMLVSYDSIEFGFSNTGNYYVKVLETSEYGCLGDTVEHYLEVFPNPETSITFNDSIICSTDRIDRIYQVNGFDFSKYHWTINGGIINSGQGLDIISVDWGNNPEPSLSVLEKTFAECTGDTLAFPLLVDDMTSNIFNVTFDSVFQNMQINGDAELINFNMNDQLMFYAGEEQLEYFSSKPLEQGEEQFIIDSFYGERLIFYQFVSINACNDSLYSDLHNNILLSGNAEENTNTFKLEWTEYLAWDRNVDYKLYEYQMGDDILIDGVSEDNYLFQNERTDFVQCFYVIAENQDNPELISRSNLLCFEFPRSLKIPDVVTANGDGFNDKFEIENIDLYPEHQLMIFNRSGRPVLKTSSYNNSWPPDDLNSGVYFYRFIISGEKKNEYAGYIHLMR